MFGFSSLPILSDAGRVEWAFAIISTSRPPCFPMLPQPADERTCTGVACPPPFFGGVGRFTGEAAAAVIWAARPNGC
jgi:hypothetical protein